MDDHEKMPTQEMCSWLLRRSPRKSQHLLKSEGGPQQTRKKAFGVNIYELNGESFLLKFHYKHMAEQTLQG